MLTLVNKHRHLAKITENVIRLRTMYHGNPQELDRHVRTLVLVYRQSEWCEGVPLHQGQTPSFLKMLRGSRRLTTAGLNTSSLVLASALCQVRLFLSDATLSLM